MLEVIIALSLAILLGNILAHKIRITPAIMLIFMGLVLALIPVHAMHEVREVGLPPHVILEIFLPVMLFWETETPLGVRYAPACAAFCSRARCS